MDKPTRQERRKLKRRSLAYYMLVKDANTQEVVGHLIDITPSGLLLDSQKPLPLEHDFPLRLDTTPDVADKTYIKFTARTKWCQPDMIEPYLFDIGFRITDLAPHDAEIVQHITEKYSAKEDFSFPNRSAD